MHSKLDKSAKKVAREIDQHFKKDKWSLDTNGLLAEVFYGAFGYHLEDVLFSKLDKKKYTFEIRGSTLMLALRDTKKRKKS